MITKPFTLHVSREGLGESVAVCIVLPHRSAALAVRQIAYEDCLQAAASARDLESAIRRHRLLPDLKSTSYSSSASFESFWKSVYSL